MMITCEKFNHTNFDELACAIMALSNDSEKNLTCEDLKDISNHCYLLRDTNNEGNIVAVIAGKRTVLDEEYLREPTRHTIQYLITDFVYDPILTTLKTSDNTDSLLTNLVREFCVDMNAWSVKYVIPDVENEDEHIKRALRTNGFIKHANNNYYLRVITAIDFYRNH